MSRIQLRSKTEPVAKSIRYITNPEKTREQNGEVVFRNLVWGINCTPEHAARNMERVKNYWGKKDRIQSIHVIQSFSTEGLSPSLANWIGYQLAMEVWGKNYQVVGSTHVDHKNRPHNHFEVNSVSFRDGKKQAKSMNVRKILEISNRICRRAGLREETSVCLKKKTPYGKWEAMKKNLPTEDGLIRADIDRAVGASLSMDEFYSALSRMGYEFRGGEGKEALKLKPAGAPHFFRFDYLGADYSPECIQRKVERNPYRKELFPESERAAAEDWRRKNPPSPELDGVAGTYARYRCYLHSVKLHPASVRVITQEQRRDLCREKQLDEEIQVLAENRITTLEDLNECREEAEERRAFLEELRREYEIQQKREERAGKTDKAKDCRSKKLDCSEKMKVLRNRQKCCRSAEKRLPVMEVGLKQLERQSSRERGKEKSNELRRPGSRAGREVFPGRD